MSRVINVLGKVADGVAEECSNIQSTNAEITTFENCVVM